MHPDSGFGRVAIVGLGLIGGSVALAIRRAWPRTFVIGVDNQQEAVSEAIARKFVNAGSTDIAAAADADLVVLAAPIRANIAALPTIARNALEHTLVTDVGSTKRAIVDAARSSAGSLMFLGGHPLAGAVSSGLAGARADLFQGRKWVFTPDDETPGERVARLHDFAGALGAIPCTMTPAEHDRVMAAVSHLPQLAASALMHVAGGMAGDAGLAFAGAGLADTTRLASSPAGIWRDVCATNADNIRTALLNLVEALAGLSDDLARGEELRRVFDGANLWRAAMNSGVVSPRGGLR